MQAEKRTLNGMDNLTRCSKCNRMYQIGDWPFCPHGSTSSANASRCLPMTYYRHPRTGRVQVPGRANDPKVHAKLTRLGYERVEMRPGREYSRWQKQEETRQSVEREQAAAVYEQTVGAEKAEARAQLRHDMQGFSREGRKFAEEAMRRAEQKEQARRQQRAPTPWVECMERDASNRLEWRDRDGRGK